MMQVGWGGQTFALAARCGESRGKRSRNRITKDERKTLVESFIKKYQSSNNGNFPSLNLTHKEVGGSFYTVREIVREVIQENKVLGPGNPTSQVLNLNDCMEIFSPEPASLVSETLNGLSTEEIGAEAIVLADDHGIDKEDMIKAKCERYQLEENGFPEIFASHKKIVSEEIMDGMFVGVPMPNFHSDDYQYGNSQIVNHNIVDVIEQSQQFSIASQVDEEINQKETSSVLKDPEISKLEHAIGTSQSMSEMSALDTSSEIDSDTYKNIERTRLVTNSLAGGTTSSVAGADMLEASPSVKREPYGVSDKFEDHSFSYQSEAVMDELSSAGDASSHAVHVNLAKLSDASHGHTSQIDNSKVGSTLTSNDVHTLKASILSETGSGQLPAPGTKSELEVKNEHMHCIRNSQTAGLPSSSELAENVRRHHEVPETVPILSAIKGFFVALVKFFTE